jgi:glycyl-tRNA synthetase beta chain
MADLLLELFSEEIPARMQVQAIDDLRGMVLAGFQKSGFTCNDKQVVTFVTPRRLALWVKDLPVASEATEEELKGPKTSAPEAALTGFMKKTGLSKDQLTERDGVYFAIIRKEGQQTADVLKTIIEDTLANFPWPKSMRWGSGATAWVRPLHSILCLFDGKVVQVEFAGVKAGNVTRGHRFLAPGEITITNPADYEAALEKAYVIVDRDKRKAVILNQATAAAKAAGLALKEDAGLLEEVTGLVEYPTVLVGTIDNAFMDLPKEVLVSEMRAHQKYFALENKDGSLADKFLITANITANDGGKAIIAGNERVLRARLADGRFFWDQDRNKHLSDWAENLKTVTYHAKLGSIATKVERIRAQALELADLLSQGQQTGTGDDFKQLVERAANLCKADLTTGMVGEFPELQGVMGRYYALQQNEDAQVANAIADHYLPLGPTTNVPTQPVSICIALADKLDTLVSMFAIGEKPTGSKDPFALRRAALGIIRIILENQLRLSLTQVLDNPPVKQIALFKAKQMLEQKTQTALEGPHRVGKYLTINASGTQDLETAIPEDLTQQLLDFFIDRLKVQLKDQGIRHDVIAAVVANGDDDLVRIVTRAQAIQDFLSSEDGKNLLAGYKRAANILAIEEKKDNSCYIAAELQDGSLKETEEKTLASLLSKLYSDIETKRNNEDFVGAMRALAELRKPVDQFFDKIMVNCDDTELRANRLRLLAGIRDGMDSIAHFALIEGDVKEQKKKAA